MMDFREKKKATNTPEISRVCWWVASGVFLFFSYNLLRSVEQRYRKSCCVFEKEKRSKIIFCAASVMLFLEEEQGMAVPVLLGFISLMRPTGLAFHPLAGFDSALCTDITAHCSSL